MNHCLTTIGSNADKAVEKDRGAVGGYTGSISTCVQHAVDGFSIWGGVFIGRITDNTTDSTAGFDNVEFVLLISDSGDADGSLTALEPWKTDGTAYRSNTDTDSKGLNMGSPRQTTCVPYNDATNGNIIFIIVTSYEFYANSAIVGIQPAKTIKTQKPQKSAAFARANYGAVYGGWAFKKADASSSTLAAQEPDSWALVGVLKGYGAIFRWSSKTNTDIYVPNANDSVFTVGQDANGVVPFYTPVGGVGQFKGTTMTDTEKKYVKNICVSVQPMYTTTFPQNVDGASANNGFFITCYTGIPQCAVNITTGWAVLNNQSSSTESTTCMNDPRYLTWRSITTVFKFDGTQQWYRMDSYYNSSATSFSSTWGTGSKLALNNYAAVDNQTTSTTYKGKTFVFAYGDGSGVQLNYVTFGEAEVTTNNTGSNGDNTLVTAPAQFYNYSPNKVDQNYCLTAKLGLEGTTDTSTLG